MPNARSENTLLPLTRRAQRDGRTWVCAALALLAGAVVSAAAGAQPAKAPVEVVQTDEGVIELRNRPDPAPSLGAPPGDGVAKRPATPSGSASPVRVAVEAAASDARTKSTASLSLGWWGFGVAVLVTLGGLSALASRRRRQRRARRELSAILADSVPLPRPEVETPSFEADSAPPRSTRNGLQPLSERQWLSQPPPSSYKDPTR